MKPHVGKTYGIGDRPGQHITPIVFVGGTGRSGTHIVARFLGRHGRLTSIGVECRFHVEDRGFPGLLAGTVTKEQFVERMRGFYWKGKITGRERGMHKFIPPERYEAALTEFERTFDSDAPDAACRKLFIDLLWPRAMEKGASGLVEQSCDTVAVAPTLMRLFPEAKFVHVIRDGRDASASRVSQTRGRTYPRTRNQGLKWFEARIRRIEEGARQIPEEKLMQVSLEDILRPPRHEEARAVVGFVGVRFGRKMRRFFYGQMDLSQANAVRWKKGLSERRQQRIEDRYVEMIERLEADGVSSAP
ncbi:MAG: sulfotransferase, partial [Solirubrobacterales bacterium]